MLRGWLREDRQALVELEIVLRDGSRHSVAVVVDTGFNGQVSLSRQVVDELDFVTGDVTVAAHSP